MQGVVMLPALRGAVRSSVCVHGSFLACLAEASQGIDGQEIAQAALHRQNDGMSRQKKC